MKIKHISKKIFNGYSKPIVVEEINIIDTIENEPVDIKEEKETTIKKNKKTKNSEEYD